MAASLEIRGWMRLDVWLSHILLLPRSPDRTGDLARLCVRCQLSAARSALTGWHVHSCLLPPAAVYSKAHTSLWSYRFNFRHLIFQFSVGLRITDGAYTSGFHQDDGRTVRKCNFSENIGKIFTAEVFNKCVLPMCGHRGMLSHTIPAMRFPKMRAMAEEIMSTS